MTEETQATNGLFQLSLSPVQSKALRTAENLLKGIGALYKIEVGGYHADTFPRVPERKRTSERKYPHGALTDHIEKHIGTLEPGQSAIIPVGEFDILSVGRTTCSWASNKWGNGSYISARTLDGTGFEILRND